MSLFDRFKAGAASFGTAVGELVRDYADAFASARQPDDNIAKGESPGKPRGSEYNPLEAYGVVTADAAATDFHPGTRGTTFEQLDRLAALPVPAIVINHVIDDLAEFCKPSANPQSYGFRIALDDEAAEPTQIQQRRMDQITKVLMNGGAPYQDGGLEGIVRRFLRPSMKYDQAPFEVLRGRLGGEPKGLFVYDGKTIRRRAPDQAALQYGQWGDPGYCQWIDNRVRAEWDSEDFYLGIRRPRPDMEVFNYGFPELEELRVILGAYARAENYNTVNFTSGIHASHLMTIASEMDREVFDVHRRMLEANFTSPSGKRRMPIVQVNPSLKEEIKTIPLGHNNREMEYTNWLFYLVKLICAEFGVDPAAALKMVFGNEGQSSSLNQGGPADRYDFSRTHGIRPKLRSIAHWLTWVVKQFDPEMHFEFVGLDSLSETDKLDMDIKQMANFMKVNEVRARYDLDPIEGPAGDVIANPYVSSMQQQAMAPVGDDEYEQSQDDNTLMQSLWGDYYGGGTIDQITKGAVRRYEHALRRKLIAPPPTWRPGRPWAAVKPRRSGREPLIVEVSL